MVLAGVLLSVGTTAVVMRKPASVVAPPVGGRVPDAQQDSLPPGFTPPQTAPATAGPEATTSSPPPPDRIPPVEVAIPAIAVDSRLVGLRLDSDGTLQVPTDYRSAGWYSDGPAPGDTGAPAVVVGHLDGIKSPGVFSRLPALRVGDRVLVRRADGTTVAFVVYRLADYRKAAFPAGAVYAPTTQPELRLITCTGTFNRATGHYLGNFVVYARAAAAAQSGTP